MRAKKPRAYFSAFFSFFLLMNGCSDAYLDLRLTGFFWYCIWILKRKVENSHNYMRRWVERLSEKNIEILKILAKRSTKKLSQILVLWNQKYQQNIYLVNNSTITILILCFQTYFVWWIFIHCTTLDTRYYVRKKVN